MPAADNPDLKINIVTEADTKGLQQASTASKLLKIDTSDLSDETKRQLGLLPELETATKKSALAAEFETFRRRELGKVLLEVGNAAGISGKALSELAGGPIGAALALVGAYEAVKKSLDDADKKMDELLELAAQPMGTGVKGLQEAWDETATALGKYRAALADGNGEDPIKKEIERAKELTLTRLEGQKKIAEAMGDTAAVARINEAIEHTSVSSLKDEQAKREAAAKKLSPERAIKDEAEAKRKFKDGQDQLTRARDMLDPKTEAGRRAAESRQEALDKLEVAKNQPDTISGMGQGPDIDNRAAKAADIAAAQTEFDRANNLLALAKRTKEQLEGNEATRQQAVTEAEDQRKQAEANRLRLKALPGIIGQNEKVQDETDRDEHVAAAIKKDVSAGNSGDHAAAVAALAESQRLGRELATAAKDAATSHSESLESIKDALNDLRRANAKLQGQINGMPAGNK